MKLVNAQSLPPLRSSSPRCWFMNAPFDRVCRRLLWLSDEGIAICTTWASASAYSSSSATPSCCLRICPNAMSLQLWRMETVAHDRAFLVSRWWHHRHKGNSKFVSGWDSLGMPNLLDFSEPPDISKWAGIWSGCLRGIELGVVGIEWCAQATKSDYCSDTVWWSGWRQGLAMEAVNQGEGCLSTPIILFVAIASFDVLEERLKTKQSCKSAWMDA